jgi:translocation and assembly module TamB
MRFKSILGALIFVCFATLFAMVSFIQTKSFGRIATKVISDLSQKRANTQVSLKHFSISLFPPGIEINQIKVKKDLGEGKKFESEFGKLGLYVGLIEFEEKKFSLGEIRISDSMVKYTSPESDEEIKEIDQKVINEVFRLSERLPLTIDTVILENAKIHLNHELLEAKRLKVFKRADAFMVRFHLANLRPLKEKDFSLDEIWGDAEIGRKNISLHRLKVQHDVHSLLLKGKIKNYPLLKKSELSLSGESSVFLKNISQEIALPSFLKIEAGYAHFSFKLGFVQRKLQGSLDLSLAGLDSNVIKAEQLITSVDLKNDILSVKSLSLINKKEKLRLLSGVDVFNFKNSHYLFDPINIQLDQFDLNNALGILPTLHSIKGELTGQLKFTYKNKDLNFEPKDGFVIHHLGLVVGKDKPFTVLMIKKALLSSAAFRVKKLKEFQMDSLVQLEHSLLDVHGMVNSELVDFKVKDAIVDLSDFGNIAQINIKGKGRLDIDVSGPISDTNINFKGKTKGFEVLGYKFGETEKDLTIALGDSSVIIHKLESLYRGTPISGTGAINYDNLDIALGINSPKASLNDLEEILDPIFSKLSFLPKDLDFNAKLDANIFGKMSLDQLKIKTEVQFTDLLAYGENINSGNFTINLQDNLLSINHLTANKGAGEIVGDFSYHMNNKRMKMDYDFDEISLSSFALLKKIKLNIQGIISGTLKGEGTTKDYLLALNGKMIETQTQDYNFEDSQFNLAISQDFIKGKISLLGSIINSDFDYSFNPSRQSRVALDVDAPALKPFATVFFGQHLEAEAFTGKMKFHLDTKFRGFFDEISLDGNLEELVFNHESFKVNYISTRPQFIIEENEIKRWDLAISEPDLFIQTKGSGRFGREVNLINEMHFNSKLFEVLFSQVLSADGFIRNTVKVDGVNNKYQFSAASRSNELNLTIATIPFPLNHLSYSLDYSNNRLVVQEMKTSLENGAVAIKGDVFFDDKYPDVNLVYSLDKAEVPILGKSILNLSGGGIILGNEPPYNVSGEIVVNKGQILNELNEFSSKSNALSQVRFLPPSQESPIGKLFNLNLSVKADTPIRISNSLMDVSLKGEVVLIGNPFRPKGEGRLFSPPGTSRVFFKNSEYFITNADLNFSPKKEITNPTFDVQALTYIASYKVYTKAYGDLERFNFDLTSDPSLPRNSILSLIAFGYTDEIQNTLVQKDQQNLTQVGVGSFVFDRFKISDILNKQFGLQVNLGTVLEQSQTDSLLSGRTQDSQGTLGRTRSATKIELKKRLDEALSLSVSSTMGGSIGQRQSMNLNYSVSKKVQLEGVYELRTNADGEEDIISNSIGGDLKFRWTFK